VANQVLQTVYYYSARARKDVVFDRVTYHQVASPRALATPLPSSLPNRTRRRQRPRHRARALSCVLSFVSRLQRGSRRARQISGHVSLL
jgi:hypothetical protein